MRIYSWRNIQIFITNRPQTIRGKTWRMTSWSAIPPGPPSWQPHRASHRSRGNRRPLSFHWLKVIFLIDHEQSLDRYFRFIIPRGSHGQHGEIPSPATIPFPSRKYFLHGCPHYFWRHPIAGKKSEHTDHGRMFKIHCCIGIVPAEKEVAEPITSWSCSPHSVVMLLCSKSR